MRRAQSLRNHTAAHMRTASTPATDDLGILKEQPEDSVEDALRRQLLECERENDRLQAQVLSLQDQLNLRPPIEHVQALQKEYKNLEILLQATQRENVKCMAEVDRGKNREKMLERELARLAGDNWQTTLNISSANTSAIHIPSFTSNHPTSSPDNTHILNTSLNPDTSTDRANTSNAPLASEAELLAHIQQIRTLILGIEENNEAREMRLGEILEKAKQETQRFETVKRQVDAQGMSVGVA